MNILIQSKGNQNIYRIEQRACPCGHWSENILKISTSKQAHYCIVYFKKWQQELGSEWVFLLKLCKADRSKSIESICSDLQETTATVIETLWEEHQSNKSHLFQLPLHIVEDIQDQLFNDMRATLDKWNYRRTRLDQELD